MGLTIQKLILLKMQFMNLKNKKIYFRFDAGGLIGFGHLGRVEAISDTCKSMGIEPIWVIRKRPSLNNVNFKCTVIWLDEVADVTDPNFDTWKSETELKEANDFLSKIKDAELVLVDHYCLYSDFVQKLKENNIKTICIFDFMPKKFNSDFVINYNVGVEKELHQYQNLNSNCHFYLGASFAPIKPELPRTSEFNLNRKKMQNVGVYLGGASLELHKKLLNIFEQEEFLKFKKIKWCINSESDLEAMKNIKSNLNIEYIGRQNTLLDFYNWTDLMIGASGVSFLERSYVGIPQVLFKVAANQADVVRYLPDEKLAFYVGDLVAEKVEQLVSKLNKIKQDDLLDYAMKAFKVYDGNGQHRFLENILGKI